MALSSLEIRRAKEKVVNDGRRRRRTRISTFTLLMVISKPEQVGGVAG